MRFAGPGSENRHLRWWSSGADDRVPPGQFDCPARCVQALDRNGLAPRLPRLAGPPLLP